MSKCHDISADARASFTRRLAVIAVLFLLAGAALLAFPRTAHAVPDVKGPVDEFLFSDLTENDRVCVYVPNETFPYADALVFKTEKEGEWTDFKGGIPATIDGKRHTRYIVGEGLDELFLMTKDGGDEAARSVKVGISNPYDNIFFYGSCEKAEYKPSGTDNPSASFTLSRAQAQAGAAKLDPDNPRSTPLANGALATWMAEREGDLFWAAFLVGLGVIVVVAVVVAVSTKRRKARNFGTPRFDIGQDGQDKQN